MKKLLLIPALLTASLALADQKKYEISPMIGYNIAEGNLGIKDDGYPVGGVEIQFNTPGSKISPEFSLLYSQGVEYDAISDDTKIARGAFNGVYTFDALGVAIPFAKLGAGVESVSNPISSVDDGFFLDAGVGAKFPFTENLALKLEAIYMAKMSSSGSGLADNNLVTMAGLTFAFGDTGAQKAAPEPKPEPTPAPKPVVVAAPVVVDGDSDKDGVLDSVDKCPNSFANAKVDAQGCELDDDNDGVLNSQDACPTTVAGAKVDEKGCNVDNDNDGVLNVNDICPNTVAGEKVNSDGCPQTVILNINFENNSADVKAESSSNINKYATFLKAHTNYSANIVGYTDSRGSAAYNQKLSQRRADQVRAILIDRGVDAGQVTAVGRGEENPVADNKTAEGRAQNRRIEAELTRN